MPTSLGIPGAGGTRKNILTVAGIPAGQSGPSVCKILLENEDFLGEGYP